MQRGLRLSILASCLFTQSCHNAEVVEKPDVTYEITASVPTRVSAEYLRAIVSDRQGDAVRGARVHKNTSPPFTVGVHLAESWSLAWIEATTEPMDLSVTLRCTLKHNDIVLTQGEGHGFVSCHAYSRGTGAAVPPPPP